MAILLFLLLIILFLGSFTYFSGINPQDVTVVFYKGFQTTHSVAVVVVGCILVGIILGFLIHLGHVLAFKVKNWKGNKKVKKDKLITEIYRQGVAKLLSGDLKEAKNLLQKALAKDPRRIDTYIAMSSLQLQEGAAEESVATLLKAKSIDPHSLEVLFKLAEAYEEVGNEDKAVKTYCSILDFEKGNRKALRNLRELHIANNRWQQAHDIQKQLIKHGPGTNRMADEKKKLLFLRFEIARQSLAEGKTKLGKADIKGFQEIIKHEPDFAPARVVLADCYAAMDRFEDAAKVLQEGYRKLGKSIFLSRLESLYLQMEDPSPLLNFYRSSLDEMGEDLMFRLFYGKLCLRLEMIDDAKEQLFSVESSGVEFPQLNLLMAEVHRRRDKKEEAIEEYQKALGIDAQLSLGYTCEACGATSSEWESRCKVCGSWGTCALVGRQLIADAKPVEYKPIHHGQRP